MKCTCTADIHQLRIPGGGSIMIRIGISKDNRIELQTFGQIYRQHGQPAQILGHAAVNQMQVGKIRG
ncbi:hypothetical protein D3C81_2140910 [compost metagenome]